MLKLMLNIALSGRKDLLMPGLDVMISLELSSVLLKV